MIQFLKSSDGRRGSVRHADPADQPPVRLESTEPEDLSAEHSALTEEEAAEIRRAFQRQPRQRNGLSEVGDMNHELAEQPAVSLMSYDKSPDSGASTSVDIFVNDGTSPSESDDLNCGVVNQSLPEALMIELEDLAVTTAPVIDDKTTDTIDGNADQVDFSDSITARSDSTQMSIDVLTVPKGTEIVPQPDLGKHLAIEHILIEGLVIGEGPNENDAPTKQDLTIEASDQLAIEASDQDVAEDNEPSPSYEEHQTGPLTYFQYYLNEGLGETAAKPADYVSPVRHPSIPSGLIGASVLGVTLVSGFVIADTLKTQSFTGAKKPPQPSQRPPLAPKTQATGMLVPQVIPPEAMPPEVDLPKPKESQASIASNPVFPPLPPLAKPRPVMPVQIAMAPTTPVVSAVLPQRSAVDEITAPQVAAPQPPSTPPSTPPETAAPFIPPETSIPLAGSMRPVFSAPPQVLPKTGPQVIPQTNELSAPAVTGTEIEVPQPPQAELTSPVQPSNLQPLAPEEVQTDIVAPIVQVDSPIAATPMAQPTPLSRLNTAASMPSVPTDNTGKASQSSPETASTSALTFDSATSGFQTAQPTTTPDRSGLPAAADRSMVAPTMPTGEEVITMSPSEPAVATAASESQSSFGRLSAIVKQPSSMAMPSAVAPVAESSDGSQFTSAFPDSTDTTAVAASAPTTLPTAPSRADQASISAQMQQLLTEPEYRGYLSPSNQWRSLTQREANVAARAEQLGAFTRQELNQQDYIRAYRLVSQQVDSLPPFGFIDYQRKLILLPPESATALNGAYQGQSQSRRNNSSRNGQVNVKGAIAS